MSEQPRSFTCCGCSIWTCAAVVLASIAVAGSVWLSVGMQLKACPLCFYQRTFMMSVLSVYIIGMVTGNFRAGALSLLAFPLVMGGLGVAGFHVYLEINGTLECPGGLFGLGTAPLQSLLMHVVVLAVVLIDMQRNPVSILSTGVGGALGIALAVLAIISAPPLPPTPSQPYPENAVLDMCRPVYTGANP